MTPTAWLLLSLTVACAVANWVAAALENQRLEWVFKPLTMVALGATLAALDLPDGVSRTWHLAAVALSLAGDVFLMLPGEREELFLGGLASFLLAHIAYVIGMFHLEVQSPAIWVGVAVAAVLIGVVGSRIAPAARRADARLFVPVLAYMVVIGTMAATAIGTALPVAILGAMLFCASDSLLGWNRFVTPIRRGHLGVMITYHLGQLGLVLALLTATT